MPKTKEKKALLPELRFPEFAGEWRMQPLEPLIKQHSKRVESSTSIPVFSSTREGLQLQSEYYGGNNRANEGSYGVVPKGYFVYRHMSDDGIFKFNINRTGKEIAVSKEYPVFTTKNLNSDFLLHLLDWSPQFKNFCLAQKKGGTRTRLYLSTLGKWKPALPTTDEQQKIADCLGSLNELIGARSAKLAALQDHKKGLLQQIFPAPGQTTPNLRFPGFEGEWKPNSLEKLCSAKISYGIVQAGPHVPDGMPYIKSTDLNVELQLSSLQRTSKEIAKKYRRSEVAPGDLVFSLRGNIGVSQIVPESIAVANLTQGTARIRPKGPAEFFRYVLQSQRIHSRILGVSKGSTFQEISLDDLRKIEVLHPIKTEQQKIADCLSSLDALITAETDHLAALKQHKKGLMQKLFPNPDHS